MVENLMENEDEKYGTQFYLSLRLKNPSLEVTFEEMK